MGPLRYEISQSVNHGALNDLYFAAWPNHSEYAFTKEHEVCLAYICAYDEQRLVGYIRVAWDGGVHAFLLEPTVHPDVQHGGVGTELVARACAVAKYSNCEWMHVDFTAELQPFYDACGFQPTAAGLIRLRP